MRLVLSLIPVLLAVVSLLGLTVGDDQLRGDFIAQGPMSPLASVSLLCLGLIVALWPQHWHLRRVATLFSVATTIVIAAATFSLSQTIVAIYDSHSAWPFAGLRHLVRWKMMILSPVTASALLILGPAILILLWASVELAQGDEPERKLRYRIALAQGMAMAACIIALFVLTGYLYHSVSLTQIPALTPMPRVTAIAILFLSLGVLAVFPRRGLMRFITNDGPSGQIARFLVPVSVIVPIMLGWLRVIGMQSHLYDGEYGLDLSTMMNVVMLGSLTLIGARKLYKSDQKARIVEQELLYRATHDSLTGLVNRPVFREQLIKRLRLAARRRGNPFAVFYLDLDGFKQVNDLLGHDAGDRLLVQVADLLRASTRASDTVARFGGDEFVILFEEIDSGATAEHLASRILAAMPASFGEGVVKVPIGISIGIATNEDGNLTPDEILRDADTAMYLAKEKGKGCYKVAGAA